MVRCLHRQPGAMPHPRASSADTQLNHMLDSLLVSRWNFFGVAGGMLLDPMLKGRTNDVSPILKEFLGWATAKPPHTGETLLDTWVRRDAVRQQVFAQMEKYPILLC